MIEENNKETRKRREEDSPGGLFIPAGVLTGMGVGFMTENLIGWLFIGLGVGFLFFAVYEILEREKRRR